MKIAICDDEKMDRRLIRYMLDAYLKEYHIDCGVEEYDSAAGLLGAVSGEAEKPALLFLDILMDNMDGMELARKIRAAGVRSEIVFITSSNSYAADAFEVNAFSYLRKPLEKEKFTAIMNRAMARLGSTGSIEVLCSRVPETIYFRDILWIETSGRQIVFHTENRDYGVYMTLAGLMQKLPQGSFAQISRFEVVALARIRRIGEKEVELDGGATLMISSKYLANLQSAYEAWRRNQI